MKKVKKSTVVLATALFIMAGSLTAYAANSTYFFQFTNTTPKYSSSLVKHYGKNHVTIQQTSGASLFTATTEYDVVIQSTDESILYSTLV